MDDSFTLTIFGASGDLTKRKLMPALFAMYANGLLPDKFRIVGFARRDWSNDHFRDLMREAVTSFSRIPTPDDTVRAFLEHVDYFRADMQEGHAVFDALRDVIEEAGDVSANRMFYLSVKPDLVETAVDGLASAGLIRDPADTSWSRVVIEKPFGRDLHSARELNRSIRRHLAENQIYRIDHYLGKETVQNILSFRFANTIFEPIFNNHYVDHIQITAAETEGMRHGRGAYYDASGALRDMVQNHLLQLLCLVTMEPPSSMTADALHNEKIKVLQSIAPPSCIESHTLRAQYTAGEMDGEACPGYVEEERIPEDSFTETFAALRLHVENWRWAGVPMYLRTGKRMARRVTEIVLQFKQPPLTLFQTVECVGDVCDLTRSKPNQLIFRIQPDEGIAYRFSAKRPVMQMHVENVNMDFSYARTWQRDLPEAYERLLLDVMRGDSTLFNRSDATEAAWRVVEPVLRAWSRRDGAPLYAYPAGSWGPDQADCIFEHYDAAWRRG